MLGAIIGDIAGSYYEVVEVDYWKKYKNLDHIVRK